MMPRIEGHMTKHFQRELPFILLGILHIQKKLLLEPWKPTRPPVTHHIILNSSTHTERLINRKTMDFTPSYFFSTQGTKVHTIFRISRTTVQTQKEGEGARAFSNTESVSDCPCINNTILKGKLYLLICWVVVFFFQENHLILP